MHKAFGDVTEPPPAIGKDDAFNGSNAKELIEIPEAVLTRCPLVQFKLRSIARHCPTCPHFKGLADRFPGSTQYVFAQRYLLRCQGAITNREVFEAETDGCQLTAAN
jgi:hypothetical protein